MTRSLSWLCPFLFVVAHYIICFGLLCGGRYEEVVSSPSRQAGKGKSSACYVVVRSKRTEERHNRGFCRAKMHGLSFLRFVCLRQKSRSGGCCYSPARPLRCKRKATVTAGLGHAGLAICDPATMRRVHGWIFVYQYAASPSRNGKEEHSRQTVIFDNSYYISL